MEADRRVLRDGAAERPHLPVQVGADGYRVQGYLLRLCNMQIFTSKCEAGFRRDEMIKRNVCAWDLKGVGKNALGKIHCKWKKSFFKKPN